VLVAVSWTCPNGADDASARSSLVDRLRLLISFVGLLPDLTTDVARIHLPDMLMICASMATSTTWVDPRPCVQVPAVACSKTVSGMEATEDAVSDGAI